MSLCLSEIVKQAKNIKEQSRELHFDTKIVQYANLQIKYYISINIQLFYFL